MVCKNQYRTIGDLKRKIKQSCDKHISTDVCKRAVRDYQRRLQKCVERGGKHIEVQMAKCMEYNQETLSIKAYWYDEHFVKDSWDYSYNFMFYNDLVFGIPQ